MNSSTSDSERRPWRRLLLLYTASLAVLAIGFGALVLALDPYDSGRFALLGGHQVPDFGQRLIAASLARRPEFDTAILGNSTVQLLDPARIGRASGRTVVSLAIPGTGPREQLAVAEWFRRHHPGAALRGLVLGIDASWCRSDGRLELTNPFPFWLYSDSALDYAANMMRLKSAEAAARKVKLLLGRERVAPADGYNDYETGRIWDAAAARQRLAAGAAHPVATVDAAGTEFAAATLLRRFLARLPESAAVVLVFPPRHHSAIAIPGSAAAAQQEACRRSFDALAAQRLRTRLLDFLPHPDAEEADDDEFWDVIHYRAPVARRLEGYIASALRQAE